MRAVFFGTPEIAAVTLAALVKVADVVAVVCQPDRPAGRGMKLTPPPVKVLATELGIEVRQPKKVRTADFADWVRGLDADVGVVIAYGRILPQQLLDAPRRGCMNLHASILPKYRGAAPINWAIVKGESESGIALMQMDAGMDTGPVFTTRTLPIGPDETAGELYDRMAALAAEVIREDLSRAVSGELEAVAQDHGAATMAPMLSREDGRIDWTRPAKQVHDHARGMTPWPGAFTELGDKRFKVLVTRLAEPDGARGQPGSIIAIDDRGAEVACGSGSIVVVRGQLAGKKALTAQQLAAGRTIAVGTQL